MLTIDNLSLGICSALHGAGAKNARSCSPECLETSRESKSGEVVRSWRRGVPRAQPAEKAAGDRTKQGLWGTWRRKGRAAWLCWKLTACAGGAPWLWVRHMTLSHIICFPLLPFPWRWANRARGALGDPWVAAQRCQLWLLGGRLEEGTGERSLRQERDGEGQAQLCVLRAFVAESEDRNSL